MEIRKPALVLLGFLALTLLRAQPGPDTLAARSWTEQMEAHYGAGRFDSVLWYGKKAVPVWESTRRWQEAARGLHTCGYAAGQRGYISQAESLLTRGLELALAHLPEQAPETGKLLGGQVALRVWQGDYPAAIPWSDRQIAFLGEEQSITAAGAFINRGVSFYYLNRLPECIEACQHGVQILKTLAQESHPYTANAYLCLGRAFFQLRKYNQAEGYFRQATDLTRQRLGPQHPNLALMYQGLADLSWARGNFTQAIQFILSAQEILEKTVGTTHPWVAQNYFNLGRNYHDLGKQEQALQAFHQALDLQEQLLPATHPDLIRTRTHLARRYMDLGEMGKAEVLFAASLRHFTPQSTDLVYTDVLGEYGLFFRMQGKYPEAIAAYDQAIDLLNRERRWAPLTQKASVLLLYLRKADVQLAAFPESMQGKEAALGTYRQAASIIDEIARRQDPLDESEYGTYASQVFRAAAETAYWLFHHTGDLHYQEEAFSMAEKNRASLLRQGARAREAQTFAGVPPDLPELEQRLKAELAFSRQKWNEARQKNDSSSISRWQSRTLEAQMSADSLQQFIAQEYPRYFRLKYNPAVSSLREVQQAMPPGNTALLEYLWTDSALLLFVIRRNQCTLLSLGEADSLRSHAAAFIKMLSDPAEVANEGYSPVSVEQLHHLGERLYRHLLAPAREAGMLKAGDKLIIIPDGILGYLPFEALPVSGPAREYPDWDYVLHQHVVRYGYAATLLTEPANRWGQPENELAGFAPAYPPPGSAMAQRNGRRFSSLQYNREEVVALAEEMGGDTFLDDTATEDRFKAVAGQYRILHLAMHTLLNDTLPVYSGLVFSTPASPDTTGDNPALSDGFLHAYEIYNLPLKAELVVLSACQTGFGRLRQGEGIMSLAHAFRYAGCGNTVMSLWPVDDLSTNRLMKSFYRYLGKGLPKDEALTYAKRDYLATPGQSHPFFWSGLVLLGDDEPVKSPFPWGALTIGLIAAGLLLLGMRRNN